MKKVGSAVAIILCLLVWTSKAQETYRCYYKYYNIGKRQYGKNQFDSAYNSFKAAKYGCGEKNVPADNDIDDWFRKTLEGINYLCKAENDKIKTSLLATKARQNISMADFPKALRIAQEAYRISQPDPPASVIRILSDAAYSTLNDPATLFDYSQDNYINAVSFSPDGSLILITSDSTVKLYNLEKNQFVALNHKEFVDLAQFSPDGHFVLTKSSDERSAKLWDLKGTLLTEFEHNGKVTDASFAPKDKIVLTCSSDSSATLWDFNGKPLVKFNTGMKKCWAYFSQRGNEILTQSGNPVNDSIATLWNLDGKYIGEFKHKGGKGPFYLKTQTSSVIASLSPDGNFVLTRTLYNPTVKVWNRSGLMACELTHKEAVTSALFSPDGNKILTRTIDSTANLWDLNGTLLTQFRHNGIVNVSWFSSDGNTILTGSSDSTVKLWDIKGNLVKVFKQPGAIRGTIFFPFGNKILTTSHDNKAKIWDQNGTLLEEVNLIGWAMISPDGNKLLTYSPKKVRIFDLKKHIIPRLHHKELISSALFSPDGSTVLTASADSIWTIWDMNENIVAEKQHHSSIMDATYSPDGKMVIVHSIDKKVQLISTRGFLLSEFNKEPVISVIFSPHGNSVLTLSENKIVKIWDLNGKILAELKNAGDLYYVIYSPDGNKVHTMAKNAPAKLWDLKGMIISEFNLKNPSVHAAFLKNGSRIITTDRIMSGSFDITASEGVDKCVFVQSIFPPDESRIMTLPGDTSTMLWDLKGNLVERFVTEQDMKGAFPKSNTIKFWDQDGNLMSEFNPREDVAIGLFSPDGSKVLFVSFDSTAKLWNLNGNLLAYYNAQENIYSAAFSPDGDKTLTISYKNTIRVWDLFGNLLAEQKFIGRAVEFFGDQAAFSPDSKKILAVFRNNAYLLPMAEEIYNWLNSTECHFNQLTPEERKDLNIGE